MTRQSDTAWPTHRQKRREQRRRRAHLVQTAAAIRSRTRTAAKLAAKARQ